MDDGTESPLDDHMRDAHQKGTRGFTEDYLASMHQTLHQRKHDPDMEPEHPHAHPQTAGAHGENSAGAEGERSSGGAKHGLKAKDRRDENRKHGRKHADRKHVDRYHGAGGRAAEETASH